MTFLRWFLIFFPALAIEIWCYLTAPFVAPFIRTEPRFDRVKRLGNKSVTLQRDYLIKPFYWYQTHDNAVDEWWYGQFNEDSYFKALREATQADYDSSKWLRYVCRVHWLWRNCAYGFHYNLFSQPIEPLLKEYKRGVEDAGFWYQLQLFKSSFQLEAQIPFFNFFIVLLWLFTLGSFLLDVSLIYVLPMPVMLYLASLDKRYFSINMGWKSHKNIPRKMYANRIPPFGIRSFD